MPMWHKTESESWTSPDGGLRIEQFIGEWEETREVGRWAVLSDARTGFILLDLSGIHDSRVELAADGAVLVWLDLVRSAGLFRIDPASRSFRNLGLDDRPGRPLEELSDAVLAELQALRQAGYRERAFSPDGSIRVDFSIETWRMSHETRSPRIVETATGKLLLDLPSDWDANILWQGASAFLIHLRRYTKPGYLTVTVDPQAGLFRIAQEGDLPHPIAGMQATLEAAFDRFDGGGGGCPYGRARAAAAQACPRARGRDGAARGARAGGLAGAARRPARASGAAGRASGVCGTLVGLPLPCQEG
jgi:hypothetical protein